MSRTSSTSRSRAASPAVRDLTTVERNLPPGWTVDARTVGSHAKKTVVTYTSPDGAACRNWPGISVELVRNYGIDENVARTQYQALFPFGQEVRGESERAPKSSRARAASVRRARQVTLPSPRPSEGDASATPRSAAAARRSRASSVGEPRAASASARRAPPSQPSARTCAFQALRTQPPPASSVRPRRTSTGSSAGAPTPRARGAAQRRRLGAADARGEQGGARVRRL